MYISATLPYSAEALSVFISNYNRTIWPAQTIAIFLTLVVLFCFFRPFRLSSRLIGLVLALFWFWTGYVFYIQAFSTINFLAPAYGAIFLAQSAFVLYFSFIYDKIEFFFRKNGVGRAGLFFVVLALVVYPSAMSHYEGQWESYRLVGVTPLATTLFTMGLMFSAKSRSSIKLCASVIPVLYILSSGVTAWFLLQ